MAHMSRSTIRPAQIHGVAASNFEFNPPSTNLWIGNVSPDVSEAELKALFEKHGKIDSVTMYPLRNYAFVQFSEVENAVAARQRLQGHPLRRNMLKIEFAKLAKPCKSLWVAGISLSVSKEELEKEFLNFGKLQEFRFVRDRNTAYVDYANLEDAIQALKSMNGKRVGGHQLRVDFLRSQSFKREHGPDTSRQFPIRNAGPSDRRWIEQDSLNKYPESSLVGSKRHQFLTMGPRDSQLSSILMISYPPVAIIEEDMLHNAMILFGEIEDIKTFPDRNFALVEFRSIEEARRAKEGLQGKLFNDPRISIEYSISELGPENDHVSHYPGAKGHLRELPFQPVRMDAHGVNHPLMPSNNPMHLPPFGIRGADAFMRPPLGPHSNFESTHLGPEFSDSASVHNLHSPNPQSLMGGPNWKRSSPTSGIISSPSGFNIPSRSGAWDAADGGEIPRETKRSRADTGLPHGRMENRGGFEDQYGRSSQSGPLARVPTAGIGNRHADSDCVWRGVISKGGSLVCHARCVSVGEGLDTVIPRTVDCSARTGLDLLSKHYDDAIGFSIVFFLPDSEEDFSPYTEFLKYLGSKDRAGVAKFDDGTTLFLVPPSDFLTKVLKVSGPERLYGVVLKFPQMVSSTTPVNPLLIESHYVGPNKTSLQPEFNAIPQIERAPPLDYSRGFPQDSNLPLKAPSSLTSSSFPPNSVPPTSAASQASLALTPELIATLTSLLPANSSSGSQINPLHQTTSMLEPASKSTAGPSDVTQWKHGHQALNHDVQHVQPFGSLVNTLSQNVPQAHITAVPNMTSHFEHPVNSYGHMHERIGNFPTQVAVSSKPMVSEIPQQIGTFTAAAEINQQYQQGSSDDFVRGNGNDHGTDASRFYGSAAVQQPVYSMSSNQIHGYNVSQAQPYMPLASEADLTQQNQSFQTASYGPAQENTESEADKNERYKTTLLFAANLLSRIHQPSGSQTGQGAGSN